MEKRKCSACGIIKSLNEYYRAEKWIRGDCIDCFQKKARKRIINRRKLFTGKPRLNIDDYKRYWEKVDISGECFEFKSLDKRGYGQFNLGGSVLKAHRISWEYFYGPVPNDMHVCHSCDNPKCVRPDHLFLGTHQDNMKDSFSKNRHPFQLENRKDIKLTDEDIRNIRELYSVGRITQEQLANKYTVSRSYINQLVNKRRRNYVQE